MRVLHVSRQRDRKRKGSAWKSDSCHPEQLRKLSSKKCDFISYERNSNRRIFDLRAFISICPYASEYRFEVCIYPVRHIQRITQLYDEEIKELAQILEYVVSRINTLNDPAYT